MSDNIAKMLEASTGNLSEATAQALPLDQFPIRIVEHEYGWFVWADEDTSNVPADLAAIIKHARALGCDWVNFDRDNEALDGFPTFDW